MELYGLGAVVPHQEKVRANGGVEKKIGGRADPV
jgi:hypothetical protein